MTELESSIGSLKKATLEGYTLLAKLERAQKDLKKSPPHKWEHGDIFKSNVGCIMVYLRFLFEPSPRTVCIVGPTGGLVERQYFDGVMTNAKFLFNIKEKL